MEEVKYWESLQAGDIQALQALYKLHVETLYSYGMVLCQDQDRVKDCIHDLFLAFWQNHANLSIPRSGKAYLMVSLRRRIFDSGPKSVLNTEPLEDDVAARISDRDNHELGWIAAEEEGEKMEKLENAMSRISDRQREIIHMKYYQQLDYEDIGRIMNLNYQSARNLVTRALMALRREMTLIVCILWLFM